MKKILLILCSAIMTMAMVFAPAYAEDDICNSISHDVLNYQTLCGGGGETELQGNVKNILNTVYFWVAIIAVIVIIIGGVKYMTSQGDAGKVKSAKDTIMYAIIGLIVTLLAFAITNFILRSVGG